MHATANELERPVNVNPLIVETPEEKRLYALGERNSKIRKERRDTSLLKHTPNDLESDIIHAFWQKQLQFHGRVPWGFTFLVVELIVKIPMMRSENLTTSFTWMRPVSRRRRSCNRNTATATTS